MDGLGVVALLVVEGRVEHESAHPDDRVHRCPDLVTHRRQEGALRLVRRVRFTTRRLELADVVVNRVEPEVLVVDDERHHQDLNVEQEAVLAHPLADRMCSSLVQGGGDEVVALLPQRVRPDDEVLDVPADHLLLLVAEQRRRGRVPAGDALVPVHRHDRDGADLDERFEVLLLAPDLGRPILDPSLEGGDVLAELGGHFVECRGERAHLVLGLHPGGCLEVAAPDAARRSREREDRAGHPASDEGDSECQEERGEKPDDADRQGQRASGPKGLVLGHFGDQAGVAVGQPLVDTDDRRAARVRVEGLPALVSNELIDSEGGDAPGVRPAGRDALHERTVRLDQECLAAGAQASTVEDDPVDSLEGQVGGHHSHALAPAIRVEQRGRHRDGRSPRERRRVRVLDGRVGRAGREEGLVAYRLALVGGEGREPDNPVEVGDVDLVGVGGLGDDRRKDIPQAALGRRARRGVDRRIEECPRIVADAGDDGDEDDIARLLVDPAVELAGLERRDGTETVIDGARQVARRPNVDDRTDNEDRHGRQEEEVGDEPRPKASAQGTQESVNHASTPSTPLRRVIPMEPSG